MTKNVLGLNSLFVTGQDNCSKHLLILVAALTLLPGCARFRANYLPRPASSSIQVPRVEIAPKLAPDQQTYLDKAKNFPLSFEVPVNDSGKAWARAKEFVQKFGTLRVQQSDRKVIDTIAPPPADVDVGYTISRRAWTDSLDHFVVETKTASRFSGSSSQNKARLNSHLLAYYIATGQLDESLVTK